MRNKIQYTLIFSILYLNLNAQSASQETEGFFDKQTIIAMIIGAIFGVIGTRLFSKKTKD